MLRFEIKQNENVNKMKLNKRFCKKIQIAVAVALSWNGN